MTGSEMAKAGLLEQNRLSGANRNTLIAGGIMANTAEIFNFPVPDAAQKEPRVADLDDGYTRIANELLEAVMLAGLTQHQLLVFLAVMRKTYGFNKKLDWVSNEQLSELTGILPHKCSAAKSVLVKRGILIQSGRNTGINNVVSEWSTLPESGKKNKVYLKEVNLPESGKKSLPKSGKDVYPNQVNTKDKLTKDNIKPFSSENSGESSDQPENDLPVEKPDAAIQSGSRWGTAEDLTAAEWMFDMVKTIAPSARKPNFAGWANDIRLMRERDGRNHRDMCVLFRWACQDNFWSGNVLSPAKLRDKWTQLEINRNKQQAGVTASKAEPAIHRWRRVTSEPYGPYPWHYGDFIGFSKPVDGIEDEYFYSAPPEPANAETVAWMWSHRKHPSEVTLVRPEDDERAEGAHWSGWSCQALYAAPPVPVSVPTFEKWCELTEQKPVGWVRDAMKEAYDGCRDAMLQGAEKAESPTTMQTAPALDSSPKISESPVSNSPVIPDGWVLVPKEPTPEMREAYHQAQEECEDGGRLWSPDHQWKAMIAAAPQQEAK